MGLPMKTGEWHQQGRSGDFIVKFKKNTFFTFLRLNKWIPDGRLLFENLFPKQVSLKILKRNCIEFPWK